MPRRKSLLEKIGDESAKSLRPVSIRRLRAPSISGIRAPSIRTRRPLIGKSLSLKENGIVLVATLAFFGISWLLYILSSLEATNLTVLLLCSLIVIFLTGTAVYAILRAKKNNATMTVKSIVETDQINTTSEWTIQRLDVLTPYEFEQLVAGIFTGLGHTAKHTGRSGDNGIDVLVYNRLGDKHVIQCKHKTVGRVGSGAVRDLAGTVRAEKAVRGVLCTNAEFSAPAREEARKHGNVIVLYDGQTIVNQLNQLAIKKNRPTLPA